jgi:hypothetical protein
MKEDEPQKRSAMTEDEPQERSVSFRFDGEIPTLVEDPILDSNIGGWNRFRTSSSFFRSAVERGRDRASVEEPSIVGAGDDLDGMEFQSVARTDSTGTIATAALFGGPLFGGGTSVGGTNEKEQDRRKRPTCCCLFGCLALLLLLTVAVVAASGCLQRNGNISPNHQTIPNDASDGRGCRPIDQVANGCTDQVAND